MSYSKQLKQFLEQAKTGDLKTRHFDREYHGLDVKVSFGEGNIARIPWISFLRKPNTTSNGIYPVYLYFKDFEILILAFGVSERNVALSEWNVIDKQSISEYFSQKYSQKPARYGASKIFKVYDVKDLPTPEVLDHDLNTILEIYIKLFDNADLMNDNFRPSISEFGIDNILESISNSGLVYSKELLLRFTASILTKPFVILTGLSGSGKTKLAQAFVKWICKDESQYLIIPVGADWTNREPLLGYPDALKPGEYVKPDSGVLDLIIQANKHPEMPYFLILDEMNLSHVERYFADFLSVMESKEEIPLYAEETKQTKIPAKLKVPSNLFIIGTVNIDETTNMFSPKVLDRANTIEFRITQEEMQNFLGNIRDVNMDVLSGKGAGMAKSFLEMSESREFATADIAEINAALVQFFGELKKTGAEFGYRSATEILRLIHQLTVLDSSLSTNQKIDIAIMQKLLPKLHGSRRKLSPVLEKLGSFCVSGNVSIVKEIFDKAHFDYNGDNVLYPLSLEKIARMYRGAIDNGFASFAEA